MKRKVNIKSKPKSAGKKPANRLPGASPISGIVPPPEHRFQPGVSGNPSGRPKLLSGAYKAMLAELDEATGLTNAELIAVAARAEAISGDVSAMREIRSATEGDGIPPAPAANVSADIDANIRKVYGSSDDGGDANAPAPTDH